MKNKFPLLIEELEKLSLNKITIDNTLLFFTTYDIFFRIEHDIERYYEVKILTNTKLKKDSDTNIDIDSEFYSSGYDNIVYSKKIWVKYSSLEEFLILLIKDEFKHLYRSYKIRKVLNSSK